MHHFLFSSDDKQAIRMFRHLSAVAAFFIFTLVAIIYYYYDLYSLDKELFIKILLLFWLGEFVFTVIIRSGLNKKFQDPSLTIAQMLWGTFYLLIISYYLNEWRSLILLAYFGMLSFGFFKLRFREFLFVIAVAIIGYSLIVGYMFLYQPERINIKFELLQLLAFASSASIMLYTGSSIHRLRYRAKNQYNELQKVLELNKKLATTDDLTGLYNRRYFMEKLSQQKALSEREDTDFVICFFDLDYFKQINDSFGHHTGDVVLKVFSKILSLSIREIDYVARFGGEEFVCLLVNTDIENAIKITERIRKSLEDYNFSDIAPSLHATVSIGLSNFKQFNTIQETLMDADNKMYRAKKLGRNKVVYENDDEENVVEDADKE